MDSLDSVDRRSLDFRGRILAAMSQALEDRVAVLQLIAEADDDEGAREALIAAYGWAEDEATGVLELQFHRVTRIHRARIERELHETRAFPEAHG